MNHIEILCPINVTKIIQLMTSLGFVIRTPRSVFVPTEEIEFHGCIINPKKITVT